MDIEVRSLPSPLNSINGKKSLIQGCKVLREQFSKNAKARQYRDVTRIVEHGLKQKLEQPLPLKPPSQMRVSRHLKHFPITPEFGIDPDEKGMGL